MNRLKFKHSGQLGDIMYSLPAMISYAETKTEVPFDIYIASDKKANHAPGLIHIGGDLMISRSMFDFVYPLLKSQLYVNDVFYVPEKDIPKVAVDFDGIRSGSINTSAGNIVDYYFKVLGILKPDRFIYGGWLRLPEKSIHGYDILIGRSTRYVNNSLDYNVLSSDYLKVGFIGTDEEYDFFTHRYRLINISRVEIKNASDALKAIVSSKVFIGNQSLFFALAESVKTARILEVFEPVPNVIPCGGISGAAISTEGLANMINGIIGSSFSCKGTNQRQHYALCVADWNIIDLPDRFDSEKYLSLNDDVKSSGIDPMYHYLKFGRKEGRRF